VAVAHRERLCRLDKAACTLGVFFNIHSFSPSAYRSAPKARTQHLHWVSARAALTFLNQPRSRVTDAHAGLRQMWEAGSENGRGSFTNSCVVARGRKIS
jgi:hypothetical protein